MSFDIVVDTQPADAGVLSAPSLPLSGDDTAPNCTLVPPGDNCDYSAVLEYKAYEQQQHKQHSLSEGSEIAHQLLNERKEKISKTGNRIHGLAKIADCMFSATPLNVVADGIHFVNSRVVEFHHNYIDNGLAAIEACNNPELSIEEKREHYATLIKTAHTIRKFEKSQKLGGMAFGVAACHINEFLAFGIEAKELLFDELIMDACIRRKPEKKASESLMEAIVEMGDGLSLHTEEEHKRFHESAPEENENIVTTIFAQFRSYTNAA